VTKQTAAGLKIVPRRARPAEMGPAREPGEKVPISAGETTVLVGLVLCILHASYVFLDRMFFLNPTQK
jgi:hypothetical protein